MPFTLPLPNGDYRIQSLDKFTYLEFPTDDYGEPAAERPLKNNDKQIWTITRSQGQYTIQNKSTQTWLGSLGTNERDLVLASEQQIQWTLRLIDGGTAFHILADKTNLCIAVVSAGDIKLARRDTNRDAQMWAIVNPAVPLSISPKVKDIVKGNYRIRNLDPKLLLTLSQAAGVDVPKVYVTSFAKETQHNQMWYVYLRGDGTFDIQHGATNTYMGYKENQAVPSVTVYDAPGAVGWELPNVGGFAFAIKVPNTDLAIGFADLETHAEEMTVLSTLNGSHSQIWLFEGCEEPQKSYIHDGGNVLNNVSSPTDSVPSSTARLPSGRYRFRNRLYSTYYIGNAIHAGYPPLRTLPGSKLSYSPIILADKSANGNTFNLSYKPGTDEFSLQRIFPELFYATVFGNILYPASTTLDDGFTLLKTDVPGSFAIAHVKGGKLTGKAITSGTVLGQDITLTDTNIQDSTQLWIAENL